MIIYEINYSEQINESALKGNNGKGSEIKLIDELVETEDKLGWKTNDWSRLIEMQARVEVPSKQECRIM